MPAAPKIAMKSRRLMNTPEALEGMVALETTKLEEWI
jgi:hypothetical protein